MNDDDPGKIDIGAACDSFLKGHVMASLGLLAEITVDDRHAAGDLVTAGKRVHVTVRVSGPSWTQLRQVAIYANSVLVREAEVDAADGSSPGLKCQNDWELELSGQDLFLAAVARGPGVTEPFWPIAKPYQPSSPDWQPYVLAISGAVRIDADGQPGFTCRPRICSRMLAAGQGRCAAIHPPARAVRRSGRRTGGRHLASCRQRVVRASRERGPARRAAGCPSGLRRLSGGLENERGGARHSSQP